MKFSRPFKAIMVAVLLALSMSVAQAQDNDTEDKEKKEKKENSGSSGGSSNGGGGNGGGNKANTDSGGSSKSKGQDSEKNKDKSDGNNGQGKGKSGENKGKAAEKHAQKRAEKQPQGKALGHDREWHECKAGAANNTEKKACHTAAKERADIRHAAIKAARANGSVGGEINVTDDGNITINGTDDVNITVDMAFNQTEDNVTQPEAVLITVDADLDRGQTFIFALNSSQLNEDGGLYSISYYDIDENGTETEANITQADSFEDVMNPDDDDGPEYWIVEEPNSTSLYVSINNWSIHSIFMAIEPNIQVKVDVPAPSVVLAVGALAGLVALRRRN